MRKCMEKEYGRKYYNGFNDKDHYQFNPENLNDLLSNLKPIDLNFPADRKYKKYLS